MRRALRHVAVTLTGSVVVLFLVGLLLEPLRVYVVGIFVIGATLAAIVGGLEYRDRGLRDDYGLNGARRDL